MPAWNPKANDIFLSALEITAPAERQALIERACGSDGELLAQVESLVAASQKAGSFLESPPAAVAIATIDQPLSERPGTQIGPYKLLQQIGEGGMGVVYMAEQTEPVQRKVALKVIKPGMDSRQVIARFEAERQALALMDHVNIARVLDAGATEQGRPYFVMELVHGVPITKYCDDNRLTPRQRLELFVPVCQAIQHAHQKGIIHRDIKPSNVMVTLYDGKPVPKVIDFGVAKATEQKLTERTLFTQYGTLVGTLEYMSPEQAEMSALGVDTRSDIYSLGVLLYELLTGSTPLSSKRMKEAAYAEILRLIKEEEPPKPSTRLSESGEHLASISAQRHTEPAKLSKLMRGELDWIVMKTLEKDRSRRYETANGFAADVQRYLNDDPVLACPPSAWYRLRKFVRRNRAAMTIGVLLALSLLVTVAGITAGVGWAARDRTARDEQAAREFAARQAKVSGQLERILDEVVQLEQAQKWSAALVSARRAQPLLASDEATAEIRERARKTLAELEFVQQLDDIRAEGGSVWCDPPPDQMAVVDRKYAKAFREFGIDLDVLPLQVAVDRIKSHKSILPPVIAAIDDWAAVRNLSQGGSEVRRLVDVINAVDPDPWRQSLRRALASKDWAAVDRLASSPEFSRQPAATLYVLCAAANPSGHIDVLRRAQWIYPGDFWINHRLGVSLIWIRSPDRVAEGIGYIRAAVALRPKSGHAMMNLGNAHSFVERYDEAEICFRKAVELDPKTATRHINLGGALALQGKLDEAIASFRKVIELDPKNAQAYDSLGVAFNEQGKLDEAIASYHKAIELDPKLASAYSNLGTVLRKQGKSDEGIASCRKAIELDPMNAPAYNNLGIALHEQGKLDEAIAFFHKAIYFYTKNAQAYNNLGVSLREQGKSDESIASFRKAIEFDPKNAGFHYNLGLALRKQGKLDETIASYSKAIELDPKHAQAYNDLGIAFSEQGKLDEGIASFRKAIELDPKNAGFDDNLGRVLREQGKWDEAIASYRKAIELDPKNAEWHNSLAWLLATCSDPKYRDPKRAVELAKNAVELAPRRRHICNTLGVAQYRAGEWKAAIANLEESNQLSNGGDAHDWFFQAMAHWQLGEQDRARRYYKQAVDWMDQNHSKDKELVRFRDEAAELLGVKEK